MSTAGPVIFFSDVHLSAERPERTRLLTRFLTTVARTAKYVVCLGDLFDFWLGERQLRLAEFAEPLDALRGVVASGVPVSFVHGNRDFQVGREFERGLGIEVRPDQIVLECGSTRVYGCHGDTLCTLDRRYQIYRKFVRSAPIRALIDAIPFAILSQIALSFRAASRYEVAAKSERTLSISPTALARLVEAGNDVIVCGHVHRPGEFEIASRSRSGRLFTLGDWNERGSYLWWESGRFELREFAG